jgi:hypothetical protein
MNSKLLQIATGWLDRLRPTRSASSDQVARIREMIDFLRVETRDWSGS